MFKKYNNEFYLFDLCSRIKSEFNREVYMTPQEILIEVQRTTGMTQVQIGNRIGTNATTVWRYLKGKSNTEHIKKSTSDNIAKYFKSAQYKKDVASCQSELNLQMQNEALKQEARDKRIAKRQEARIARFAKREASKS